MLEEVAQVKSSSTGYLKGMTGVIKPFRSPPFLPLLPPLLPIAALRPIWAALQVSHVATELRRPTPSFPLLHSIH